MISVGNLTTGGTGKTPMVAWLARWFRDRGVRVTLISRGYGAEAGSRNDEALELEMRLPDVPHLQNPDRVAAAQTAIEEFECQLIVLDDAFQHRRIFRDLDIVLIDALEPFGYGHLLPRGLLREPLESLRRAHVVALSRADLVDDATRVNLRRTIQQFAPDALLIEVVHRPRHLQGAANEREEIDLLRGKRVSAFCGIGNPLGFRRLLEQCGAEVIAWREFPDHHPYSRDDVSSLSAWANSFESNFVVCTMKDFVKLRVDRLGDRALRAITIDAEIIERKNEFEKLLESLATRAMEQEAT